METPPQPPEAEPPMSGEPEAPRAERSIHCQHPQPLDCLTAAEGLLIPPETEGT